MNALSQSLRERAPLSQHHAFAVSPSRKSPGSETGARFHQAVACEYKIYVIKIYVCSFFLCFSLRLCPAKWECSRPPFLKTKAVLAPCEMKSLLCSVFFLFEKKPKPSTFVPAYLRCISVCLYPGLMKAGCVCLLRSPINVCQPAAVAFVRRYQYPVGRASAGAAGIVVLFSYSAHLKEKDVNEGFDWKRCLHSPICSTENWPILLLKSEHVLFPYAPTFETCKMNMSFIDILRLKTY